jgi:hypothetical protein
MSLPSIASRIANALTDIINESQERSMVKKKMREEIQRIRQERELSKTSHAQVMENLRQHLVQIQERMKQAKSKECPVHQYASLLKNEMTPSNIIILQAQVCRQVHYMCVDVAQLRLLENTLVTLKELAKEQEERQLERILWYTGAKVELQQQEAHTEEEQNKRKHDDKNDAEEASGIDDLVDKLSKLKDFPTTEEITVEDLKEDKKRSVAGFEHLLEDSQKSEDSKKSWELIGSCDLSIYE